MSAPELTALKNMPISFPGLFGDWEFNPDPIAIHIGHGVYWYGIILALAFLAGLVLCMKQAKRYGLTEDNVLDFVLWAVPCCILVFELKFAYQKAAEFCFLFFTISFISQQSLDFFQALFF